MTNDTTTLNGALMELGETMASNLTSKGVTASANDGLTTLAGKILKVPTEYLVYGTDVNMFINTGLTKTITSTECVITSSHTSTRYIGFLPDCTVATTLAEAKCIPLKDYCIEMDYVDYTSGSFQVYGTSSISLNLSTYAESKTNFHLKVTVINKIVKCYIDNTLSYTSSSTNFGDTIAFRFAIPAGVTIKFKNVKIYEI